MIDMVAASIGKKQIALLIEALVGKPANPNDRASAERRFLKELDSSGIAPAARKRILAQTDFESMNAALVSALAQADVAALQEAPSTALADAAKRLGELDDATAELDSVVAAEKVKEKAKTKTKTKTVTVPAGLADKPRIRKGAQVREDGLEEGGPDAILVDAVSKPGGALHSQLCVAVGGWKKCDRRLARAAALVGLTLKSTREGSDTRFEVAS
jgi:hypothetical protein